MWSREINSREVLIRFNTYRAARLVSSYEFWMTACSKILSICLHSWASFADSRSKEANRKRYGVVYSAIMNCMPDCAVLIGNHIMGMMSAIGLLPFWFQREAMLCHHSRPAEYFRDRFEIPNCKTNAGWIRIISTLESSLENNLGWSLFHRLTENLICKAYRATNNKLRRFNDFFMQNQHLYSYEAKGMGIIQRGEPKRIVDCLVERFAFGEYQMTMREIADYLRLPSTFPTNDNMWGSVFCRQLFRISVPPLLECDVPYPRLESSLSNYLGDINEAIHWTSNQSNYD